MQQGVMIAFAIVSIALTLAQTIYTLVNRPSNKPMALQDQLANSTNGSPIPIGYGTCRFAGQIIWSTGIRYIGQTSKKGGQPGYYASMAFAFGEGPGRITRIWGDSKFVWTSLPASASEVPVNLFPAWDATTTYNPGNEVGYNGQVYVAFLTNTNVIPSSGQTASGNQLIWGVTGDFPPWNDTTQYSQGDVVVWNNQFWVNTNQITGDPGSHHGPPDQRPDNWKTLAAYYKPPTIYQGTQTQLPDPLIQAAEGVAVTSAMRGLIYVVFENLPLQNFGNRIPNLRAEVTFYKTNNLL